MSGDDQEVLDWGNEDDELQVFDSNGLSEMKLGVDSRNGGEQEDDAVSLGDDEDEDIYPYRPTSQDETITDPPSTPRGSGLYHNGADKGRDIYRESSITSQKSSRRNDSPSFQRTQSFGKMVHALPPKPVVALPPPAHSPPTQNTRASAMVRRERRSNGHAKHDSDSREASSLPPDWEERYPRNGSDRGPYYFNTKTQTATWQHPGTSSATGTIERNKDNDVASRDDSKFSGYNRSEEDYDASPRREGKRRSSPVGPLSYEDRHYRPSEDTVTTGSSQSTGRRSVYSALPPRPISPRLADNRRVSRVSSPPRRRDDQERGVRSRGDRSPLPDDRNGRRDKLQEYPELSPDDRTWVARRSDSPPPPLTDRIADNRSKTSRGRRDRSNPEPPPQPASVSQGVRNDNEWSASRPRSPVHRVREPSPPRRYPDADAYIRRSSISPPRHRNRIERSLSRDRSNAMSSYEPGGIPQRRAREDDAFYDVEAKRRRTDYSPVELVKERDTVDARDSRADYNAGSSMTDTVESSRPRKRQPLPPQSTRFREASKKPVLPEPALPLPSTQHSGVTRSQPSQSHRDPPTGPSGRGRNRGDNGIRQARESDIMDVDQQTPSRPVPSRAVPSRNTDRVNGSPNVLPTAPRAMGKISGQSYPPTPPHTTQELNWRRPLPPHLQDTSASVTSSIPNAPSRSDRSSRRATGSNNTPLGEKYPEQTRLDIPSAPIADRSRQQPTPTHLEAERARRADDYNKTSSRSASYQSASPIDRVKILPPVNEPTSRWPAREETRNGKDRGSPPPSNLPTSRPSLPQKDYQQPSVSERGPRVSRFGPERVQVSAVVEAESRQWLTREEAERSGLVNSVGRNTNVRPPTPPPVASRDRRRADSDSNRYATDRRYHSPEDHVDHSSHNERPSLEGRLSRERDSSFTGRPPSPVISRRGGRQSEQNGITHERRDVTRGYRDDDVVRSAQSDYPPAKQGTTLLDRLTEPSYDSAPSLRERVNPLVSGIAGLPPRPAMEVSLAAGEEGSKGDRGPRRRNGGRRKGRR